MDKKYWDEFYKKHGYEKGISNESSFAQFCQNKFFYEKQFNIIELGSGNGRDAIYFLKNNHKIVAVEQSIFILNELRNKLSDELKNNFIVKSSDFTQENYVDYGYADVFYSRFTMHAVTKIEEDIILNKVYKHLPIGGLFCIEARTTKDPLYKIGEYIEENTYCTDHSRRFIDSEVFIKRIIELGFKIRYFTEENNLSIYKEDNPVLMRIILEK